MSFVFAPSFTFQELVRKTKIGDTFYFRGTVYRRGRGIIYKAHAADWIIERAYRKREKSRQARMSVEPV